MEADTAGILVEGGEGFGIPLPVVRFVERLAPPIDLGRVGQRDVDPDLQAFRVLERDDRCAFYIVHPGHAFHARGRESL